MKVHFKLILIAMLLIIPNMGMAQFKFPSLSPEGSITQVVGNTKLKVQYERPTVRGREIYGDLVPWNEVWRTGAGKCTRISFDQDVVVGNQPIEAGSYSLFTIPNKKEWTVIFNRDTTLNGSGWYDAKKDIARFAVKPKMSSRFYEALTIDIDIVSNNAKIYVSWADVQIDFDVRTRVDEKALKYIEEQLLKGKAKNVSEYGIGADYLNYNNTRYREALLLAQKMIDEGGNEGWGINIKWQIYEKMHLYDKALAEIEKGLKNAQKTKYENEAWRQNEINGWNKHAARIKNKQKN